MEQTSVADGVQSEVARDWGAIGCVALGSNIRFVAGRALEFACDLGQDRDHVFGAQHLDLRGPCAVFLPQVRAGSIKAYAVMAESRMPAAPDIPTVEEAGLPGFHASNWHGLWAPKGTLKDVIARLNAAIVDALADPAVRSRLADLAQEIFPRDQQTPQALAAYQKAEIETVTIAWSGSASSS